MGIVRFSSTAVVCQALPAKLEFASPLFNLAVQRGILSKCDLLALMDYLGCFALETKVANDRTIFYFFSFFIFKA